MFTGQDKNTATSSPTSTTQPYSSYRFNAMRWDSTTGQYDMGFRTYNPGLNQFVSRDMYDGALADMGLTSDPFTGGRYAFGDGNPISNTELDGHTHCDVGICPTLQQTQQVTQQAAAYGAGCPSSEPGCPGNASNGNKGNSKRPPIPCVTEQIIFCWNIGTNQNDGTQAGPGNNRNWYLFPGRCTFEALVTISCGYMAATGNSGESGGNQEGGGSSSNPWEQLSLFGQALQALEEAFARQLADAVSAIKNARGARDIFNALKAYTDLSRADVAARLDLGDQTYVGSNLARDNPTIPGTWDVFVKHAEGDAFSEAVQSGINYQDQSGTLYVSENPCGICVTNISAVARQMGLSELTIETPGGFFGRYTPETGLVRP